MLKYSIVVGIPAIIGTIWVGIGLSDLPAYVGYAMGTLIGSVTTIWALQFFDGSEKGDDNDGTQDRT